MNKTIKLNDDLPEVQEAEKCEHAWIKSIYGLKKCCLCGAETMYRGVVDCGKSNASNEKKEKP